MKLAESEQVYNTEQARSATSQTLPVGMRPRRGPNCIMHHADPRGEINVLQLKSRVAI